MVKPKKGKVATESYVWRVFNYFEERIDKRSEILNKKFDKMMEHIVDIAGKFKKFDEEQVVLAERSKKHENRIEKLEGTVFKIP